MISSIIGGLVFLMFCLLGLLLFAFWLWMLIDAIKNPRLQSTERIVWVLVIVFLHFLGALIYLLAGRSGRAT